MVTAIERRDFLRQAFMAGLVIGFPWPRVSGDEPAPEAPSPIAQARAEMTRRAAPGVLFVVPGEGHESVVAQLNRLFGGTVDDPTRAKGLPPLIETKPELTRLFARAVFVCATEKAVEAELGAKAAHAAVVRLDPGGEVAEVLERDAELVGKNWDEVLVPRLVALLDGPDGKTLEAAAAHQRAAFPAHATDAGAAVARLDSPEYVLREKASAALLKICDRLGNALELAARRTEAIEVRTRLEAILAACAARQGSLPTEGAETPEGANARLVVPLGTQWGLRTVDPCPGCGMGSASHPVRRYITLVAAQGK